MDINDYREYSSYIKTKGNFKIGRVIERNTTDKLVSFLSHHTPCEINLPKRIEIIYNWNNLEEFEECKLDVLNIKLSGRTYYQTKLGHSCKIQVKYNKWYSLLDLSLNCEKFDLVLGFCEKSDWKLVRSKLTEIRRDGIQE